MKPVIVPSMGESITEGTLGSWKKKVGDVIKQDETIVEIETDKVAIEVNAPAGGVLKAILIESGTLVKVNDILANIDETGTASATPARSETVVPDKVAQNSTTTSTPAAMPSAKKLAAETGVDLSSVAGSGKSGQILKSDVAAATNTVTTQSAQPSVASEGVEKVKMSRLRQTIAKRLKEAQNTAAILTTFNEVDMSSVMQLRNETKDLFEKKHGTKLGFMSFFVKAAVQALKAIPGVNAEINGDEIIYKDFVHMGIAVGTDQGLVVPVVKHADKKSFAQLESEIANYGKKAKEGKLGLNDLQGGSFTITNGGVYGSLMSTPIINPPQSAILGLHAIKERPIAVNGQVVIRPMMYIALSYDHRLIDGKEAVTFLVRIKELMEDPRKLLLDI